MKEGYAEAVGGGGVKGVGMVESRDSERGGMDRVDIGPVE
jgi:hypothetical protein